MNLRSYLDTVPPGGKAAFARSIHTSMAYLYQMANGIRPVPGPMCRAISEATQGAVTVHELRPDIFGPPPGADLAPALPSPDAEQAA